MKQLTVMSTEPISVQYDQTSNRLKDLLNEIELKSSRIQRINSTITDDLSFEQNRLQLITHLEDTQKNVKRLIDDREQIQLSVQTLDQTVAVINQNIKMLRTNLENYRLANNNIDELQVKKIIHLIICKDKPSSLEIN
jgi:DNA repair exonuclease SbcCD ATPase subunit